MLTSGQDHREDGQMHRELQGTRILRSSGATPHRQTDSDSNKHLQLKRCDECTGCVWGGLKKTEKETQEDESRGDKPDECGSESEGVREGRGEKGQARTDSQRWPKHEALLVPTK